MASTIIYGSVDGNLHGRSNPIGGTYAEARDGTYGVGDGGINVRAGQIVDSALGFYDWIFIEGFVTFDTTAITDVSAAYLSLLVDYQRLDEAVAATVQARARDYGSSLEVGDFVPGADLAALTLLAHASEAAVLAAIAAGTHLVFSDDAMAANVVLGGATRMILVTDREVAGTAPTADPKYDDVSFFGSAQAGTSQDPYLTVYTQPYSMVPRHYPGFDSKPL